MLSLRLRLSLAALFCLSAIVPVVRADRPPSLTCPTSTGREATLVLQLPEGTALPLQEGWLVVSTASSACVGQAAWHPELRTLTIHGDDPFTPEADGARPGEALQLHLYGPSGLPVDFSLTASLSDDACVSCNADLIYEHDRLYVINRLEVSSTTGVDDPALAITAPSVKAPYPNPTRGAALLEVALPAAEQVRIVLFDMLGREVHRPHDAALPAGVSHTQIDTRSLASGTYLLRVQGETFAETRSLVVVD